MVLLMMMMILSHKDLISFLAGCHMFVQAPGAVVFVGIVHVHFLARCHKRRLNQGQFGFVRFSFWVFRVCLGCCRFTLSVPEPSDWLKRLVTEMSCCVSSGMLNSTFSLTPHIQIFFLVTNLLLVLQLWEFDGILYCYSSDI